MAYLRNTATFSPLIRPFYPALDGMRSIAFLAVFAVHYCSMIYGLTLWRWGWVGVDLFFVVSGFLITGILFDSISHKDYFKNFYIRRSLRIFPLYYSFWLVLLLLTPVFHFGWNTSLLGDATYVGNLLDASANMGHRPTPGIITFLVPWHPGYIGRLEIGHFWTLCVEEQFYLAWPAIIWLMRSRRALLNFCLTIIVVLPILRLIWAYRFPESISSWELYFSTFFRIDTLLVGAALALWLRGPSPSPRTLRRGATAVALVAPLLLAFCYSRDTVHSSFTNLDFAVVTIGYSLVAVTAGALVLLTIDPSSRLSRILQWRPLISMGRLTYGMYILHALPLAYISSELPFIMRHHMGYPVILTSLLLSIGGAWLSFRYIESPFLRLKGRLAPRPGAANDPPPDPSSVHFGSEDGNRPAWAGK